MLRPSAMLIRAHITGGLAGRTDGSALTHLTTLETEQSMAHARDAVARKFVCRRRLCGIELDEVERRLASKIRRALDARKAVHARVGTGGIALDDGEPIIRVRGRGVQVGEPRTELGARAQQ